MKALDEASQVREVAAAWRRQYPTGDRDNTYAALLALGPTATAADVSAIIGNTSWVEPRQCNECGAVTWACVQLGEPPDYESRTATICRNCLRKAIALAPPSEGDIEYDSWNGADAPPISPPPTGAEL